MLIPCALADVVSAYLEAGDFTSSSRATYRRVLGELTRGLGPERPAKSITADELAAWFMRTRDAYAPATWNRDQVIVRPFVRILQAQSAALDLPAIGYRRLRPARFQNVRRPTTSLRSRCRRTGEWRSPSRSWPSQSDLEARLGLRHAVVRTTQQAGWDALR